MKKLLGSLVLAMIAGGGCLSINPMPIDQAPTPPPKPASRPQYVLTPDQITPANAHQKLRVLQAELERE